MDKILMHYDDLPRQQKKIADYITSHFDEVIFLTISKLAAELGISEATVVRFAKVLGYSGFPELKRYLVIYYKEYITPDRRMQRYLGEIHDKKFIYEEITEREIQYLQESIDNIMEKPFYEAVDRICSAENIFIFGNGANESLSGYLSFRLNRFKLHAVQIAVSGRNLFEKLLHFNRNDVVVVYSFYKPSLDFRRLMNYLHEKEIKNILITDMRIVSMVKYAEVVLYARRGPFGVFHSQIVPMAITNALIIAVAEKLGKTAIASLKELSEIRQRYYFNELSDLAAK
ncbi:MAG: MurR/RpiR family transcriptional regulator [Spirochaetes bacterium]|nr:MurR/RpiR family transcriptional regulator [Spirochaetota bacterium]